MSPPESQAKDEEPQSGVPDEDLPPDLVAGDDNPLAEGLPPGETVEGLLDEDDEDDEDEEPHQGEGT